MDAGLHYVNPCTEAIHRIDMKTQFIDLENQVVVTKDNVSITINPGVAYRIIHANKAKYKISDVRKSITFLTFSALRDIGGQMTLQEILEKRKELSERMEQSLEAQCL